MIRCEPDLSFVILGVTLSHKLDDKGRFKGWRYLYKSLEGIFNEWFMFLMHTSTSKCLYGKVT